MFLHGTSRVNGRGHLEIGGCDTTELAHTYGTPLYIYDEALIREKCRAYVKAFEESGFRFQVAYASKAFMCIAMCQLIAEENMSLDVVSSGELYTALKAGFPAERIHFHGNNKTEDELKMALDAGIGCFVVDNFFELELLHDLAQKEERIVSILLRLTPGIEAHTHEYISTGQDDSKFGFGVASGQALQAVKRALDKPFYKLLGIHSHIGSQIFETTGFIGAIEVLGEFLEQVRTETKYEIEVLNLGGGFGIRYTAEDDPLPVSKYVQVITEEVRRQFTARNYPLPEIWIEPGRSIVGEAGTTLYTVGAIKDIPGIRKYVAIDGGMSDNIRPALYQAKYEAMLANRADEPAAEVVSIAGKCCESGDMLIWDYALPKAEPGDLLAVSCTGAYGYSMANNYNRIRRPAVVFVKDGRADVAVKRESYEDLVRNDRVIVCALSQSV
ncbi:MULTISPECIES: diaminopimelate decarboxylase [Aneurinibacillus]|uniref:Diaminopimelate decarboxylase n=1 Tax=Aneurinibacillus thermoaerophilus TaxID=143495 RepID=A0A1G7XN50_ANETH|nr:MULTISPECIES: diaminopimelate decarboxylase [Aneurinibacillus]AMA73657.1 diaminopimelate decarboxylase [Aneurinibacillus sp. XH2]MED0675059.1 diaminopimelate decarboxylase [Aneurinibacillus thermoaerophilus]MED0679540.1 diaminopimelate decarboxylase [Aneurinibacillus thermoaerophilus]MED0737460.1 diaminopimelate decarboxylase [Aneurinibacillus thermoaerophilus]MED0756311.1 diaminopimelate decarboxylase [Aneurinibacillus thermoaerophilus]